MMKIIGYSERGAMNALFYGMAFDKDNGKKYMRKFLKLANIENPDKFSDFEIYNEFSLSEFGDPDLVIIAKQKEGKSPVVFFLEAKVSEGTSYNMDKQKKYHEEYINNGSYDKGHASNLFFQLRLKHYFFSQRESIIEPIGESDGKSIGEPDRIEKTEDRNGDFRFRKIGKNPIVIKFAEKIKPCVDAYYIAIIPESEPEPKYPDGFPATLKINYVSWENIRKSELGGLLEDTLEFNKFGNVSQILNRQNKK